MDRLADHASRTTHRPTPRRTGVRIGAASLWQEVLPRLRCLPSGFRPRAAAWVRLGARGRSRARSTRRPRVFRNCLAQVHGLSCARVPLEARIDKTFAESTTWLNPSAWHGWCGWIGADRSVAKE